MFEYLDHNADIGVLIKSENLEDIFRDAFKALKQYCYEENFDVNEKIIRIELNYKDFKYLLHDFLADVLYNNNIGNYIASVDDVVIGQSKAMFICSCLEDVKFKNEIKAITNHQLEFKKNDEGYLAKVFFDI